MRLFFWVILCFFGVTSCNSQKQLNPEQQEIINQAKANFVFVEGGTFIIGNKIRKDSTKYQVTLDSYSISKYETTFKEYDLFADINGLEKTKTKYRDFEEYGPNYGVQSTGWYNAQAYCEWLGKQLNLPISLPSEAQWEYAARSRGLVIAHATNNGKIEGSKTQKRNYDGKDVPVGKYPPNPLGIYDMSGSKPEWVYDWMRAYQPGPRTNPRVDTIYWSKEKVVRGFHNLANSTYLRGSRPPELTGAGIGFRCGCNQKTPIN